MTHNVNPAFDIYANELWALGHGHPLWGPEPDPNFGAVRLCDVGYLREGYFCFLFNCLVDENAPIHYRGVPMGFEVFNPRELLQRHRENAITQSQLHSSSISSLSIAAGVSVGYVV